jgi:hypothetical protein
VFYAFILLLYIDPGSGIRKALFSRIPDPLKKAKDPVDPDSTDPDLHHWLKAYKKKSFVSLRCRFAGGNKNITQKKGEISLKMILIIELRIILQFHGSEFLLSQSANI